MDNPIPVDLGRVAQDLQIRRVQVESVVQLLDEGNTVPFITRYRKERTGNLNEVVIREIQLRVHRLRELAERKETILKAIEAQGKLNPELEAAIRSAENPKRLEDLYLPFKPKKRTKASDARDKGLEPLAVRVWNRDELLTDPVAAAQEFVSAEKGLETPEKVLEGVGHILAEAISEMAAVRDAVRKVVWKSAKIATSKGDIPEGQGLEYRDYFDYSEPLSQVPPHRVLAINRGDKEGPLKIRLEVPRPELEAAFFHQLPLEGHPQAALFRTAAMDALDRLILPSMEREVRRDLTDAAEKHAVEVFARNLRSLLLQPPIPKQVVLAIDPGLRSGCKVAVLDPHGNLLDHGVVYPHAPQNRRSET
ncbi:MAG: Tex-like N-terminal domain-containing protein, partial [Isosphaeraceae bacterium]